MTDDERTELLIRVARALGWQVKEKGNLVGFVRPDGWRTIKARDTLMTAGDIPNPLENPADCEALLVVIQRRGWSINHALFSPQLDEYGITLRGLTDNNARKLVTGGSKNPDPIVAYRESVTLAAVRAWEAENTHQSAQDGVGSEKGMEETKE